MEFLQGKLLVASPALHDPNFRKTVVLVAHHDQDGAMGLVLSRPPTSPPLPPRPRSTASQARATRCSSAARCNPRR